MNFEKSVFVVFSILPFSTAFGGGGTLDEPSACRFSMEKTCKDRECLLSRVVSPPSTVEIPMLSAVSKEFLGTDGANSKKRIFESEITFDAVEGGKVKCEYKWQASQSRSSNMMIKPFKCSRGLKYGDRITVSGISIVAKASFHFSVFTEIAHHSIPTPSKRDLFVKPGEMVFVKGDNLDFIEGISLEPQTGMGDEVKFRVAQGNLSFRAPKAPGKYLASFYCGGEIPMIGLYVTVK